MKKRPNAQYARLARATVAMRPTVVLKSMCRRPRSQYRSSRTTRPVMTAQHVVTPIVPVPSRTTTMPTSPCPDLLMMSE